MKKLTMALTGLGLSAAVVAASHAEEFERQVYVNAGLGLQTFDDRFQLDDAETAVFGAEARFLKNWGLELMVNYAEPDNEDGIGALDAEVTGGSLSTVYYFANSSNWLPYTALGVGHKAVAYDNDQDDEFTEFNAGLGVRYIVNDNLHIRGDARALFGADDESEGSLITIGLSYAFGGGSSASPDRDSDGDGVNDRKDKCPNTPAGVAVDASGCALDGDGDGVPNYRDKCPNTEAGAKVDEFGCKFSVTETESIKLRVLFAFDSAEIPQAFTGDIRDVANFMKAHPSVKAVVEGHTDSVGSESYNQGLSQRRADAVRNALINDYGIASNRLSAVGFGEGRPIADNSTSEGRQKNRRVMAVIQVTTEK